MMDPWTPAPEAEPETMSEPEQPTLGVRPGVAAPQGSITRRLVGTVPAAGWNRLGTRLVPKLRAGGTVRVDVEFSVTVDARLASGFEAEVRQALEDLGLSSQVRIERA